MRTIFLLKEPLYDLVPVGMKPLSERDENSLSKTPWINLTI